MQIVSMLLTHHKTPNNFFYNYYNYYRNNKESIHRDLSFLKLKYKLEGVFLFFTCHRFELYISEMNYSKKKITAIGMNVIKILFSDNVKDYEKYIESFGTKDSLKHILGVAAGIDSIIIGEVDIIEQIRESYQYAKKFNNTDIVLNSIIEFAYNFGKKIRKDSKIERGLTSYASIPFEYFKNHDLDIFKRKVIVLGTGMLGNRVVQNLVNKKIKNIFLTSRNYKKAVDLVKKYKIKSFPLAKIEEVVVNNSVVICCFAGGEINELRGFRKTLDSRVEIFDFGIPSNIPVEMQKIKEIKYLSIDDFQEIITKDGKKKKNLKAYLKNFIHEQIKNDFKINKEWTAIFL